MALQEGYLYRAGRHWGILTDRGFVSKRDGVVKLLAWEEFADGCDITVTSYAPFGSARNTAKKAMDMVGSKYNIPFDLWYIIPSAATTTITTKRIRLSVSAVGLVALTTGILWYAWKKLICNKK